jgi:uncharacterized membrane protein
MEKQNRLQSWALWLSIAALAAFAVKEIWKIDISEKLDTFLNLLLPVLVGFGIINDPTTKNHI